MHVTFAPGFHHFSELLSAELDAGEESGSDLLPPYEKWKHDWERNEGWEVCAIHLPIGYDSHFALIPIDMTCRRRCANEAEVAGYTKPIQWETVERTTEEEAEEL